MCGGLGLREGVKVQRRPGTLLALGLCRGPGVPWSDQDQPTGRRAVDQRREGLREGIPIQRRPGTLLALGLWRWPVQVKTAAKPNPGPRTSRGGLRLREGIQVQRWPGSARLTSSGRGSGPAPAGLALGLWRWPLA